MSGFKGTQQKQQKFQEREINTYCVYIYSLKNKTEHTDKKNKKKDFIFLSNRSFSFYLFFHLKNLKI